MEKSYTPGLHILSTFKAAEQHLTDAKSCRQFFNDTIAQYQLAKVGEAYHSFDNGGFTAIVCLTESHLSIHTWPEYGIATFDVFLSNFNNDNSNKVRAIYQDTLRYFNATETNKQEMLR